jgi:hypothetical protein
MSQQPDWMLDTADERDLVVQLTRDVLADAAPEETGVFAADEDGWIAGRAEGSRSSDEMLGFGADAVVLLTPYVVAAAAAAVRYIGHVLAEVVDAETRPLIARWVRHVLRQDRGEPGTTPLPALSVDLVRRVRDVTFTTCHDLGLADDDASLVSDAVAGRLAVPPASQPRR